MEKPGILSVEVGGLTARDLQWTQKTHQKLTKKSLIPPFGSFLSLGSHLGSTNLREYCPAGTNEQRQATEWNGFKSCILGERPVLYRQSFLNKSVKTVNL